MTVILGLDLGPSTTASAIRDTTNRDNQLNSLIVTRFEEGVGNSPTGEFSYAAKRREKRSKRNTYRSRKYRSWKTLETLINLGYCPMAIESLNQWRYYSKEEARELNNGGRSYPIHDEAFNSWLHLDFDGDGIKDYLSPYQLRRELSETKLDMNIKENRYKFGRALYHIAHLRGFKSSRGDTAKNSGKDGEDIDLKKSENTKNGPIQEYFKKYPDAKTIGALYAYLELDRVRIRKDTHQFAIRVNFKDEVKFIFDLQEIPIDSDLYKELVESKKGDNDGYLFYVKKIKSQSHLVGKCTLETKKRRCHLSHPEFEKFRAWSFMGNIKIKPSNKSESEFLPYEIKSEIYKKLFLRKKPEFPFSDISKFLTKKFGTSEFNYDDDTNVRGCPVTARLIGIFGEESLSKVKIPKSGKTVDSTYYDIEDIWHVLRTYNVDHIEYFATKNLKLGHDKAHEFVILYNSMPEGYASLSMTAIKKINRFLEKGFNYTQSVLMANIPSMIGEDIFVAAQDSIIREVIHIIDRLPFDNAVKNVTNHLISRHLGGYAEFRRGYKDNQYVLNQADKDDIEIAISEKLGNNYRHKNYTKKNMADKVAELFQEYYKKQNGYYKLNNLTEEVTEFIKNNFEVIDGTLKIYHHSDIQAYPKARPDKDGKVLLGNPIIDGLNNPVVKKVMFSLRKTVNQLIKNGDVDSDTRVIIETAREINDINHRWAINKYQRERESENKLFEKELAEYFPNSNHFTDTEIDKYRLWIEQDKICIYTGRPISLAELFNSTDFEHTIPKSLYHDDSLSNLTICYSSYNRNIKGNKLPYDLPNYNEDSGEYTAILPRLKKWEDIISDLEKDIKKNKLKSKTAATKPDKDKYIRKKNLAQIKKQYWENKIKGFKLKEVPKGFTARQLVDTRIITKYAINYLRSYFDKVENVNGSVTSQYRKVLGLPNKNRGVHTHHAEDAAILTLLPRRDDRDAILAKFQSKNGSIYKPYPEYNPRHVMGLVEKILINNIVKDQALTPAKPRKNKDGKKTHSPGDIIRGELSEETFLGAYKAAKKDSDGKFMRDENNKIIPEDSLSYGTKKPLKSFNSLAELEPQMLDNPLFLQLAKQVIENYGGNYKKAVDGGLYMMKKDGVTKENKIRSVKCRTNAKNPLILKKHSHPSDKEYKQHVYVVNKSNVYFALYRHGDDTLCDYVTLKELADIKSTDKNLNVFANTIEKNNRTYRLNSVLSSGIKVIFLKEGESIADLRSLEIQELSKRLYVYEKYESNKELSRLMLRHHLEAREDKAILDELKIKFNNISGSISFVDFDDPIPMVKVGYKKYKFAVENTDFEIGLDGKLIWY